ncbi:hypothetical protein [Arcticibacterium luteifluviistationis]|uniref:Uncharacterized protein n=1 Tax=Arcticibacterium luteifluviistationis TaxID=1784714 RepID=A0A2Z4G984_9BACT|nr:hypothetical protein [Arcticibacterium luteifluviistationis]AWV97736.1 hypothetical protein DJ013_05965 [Arcticibacterium luteifluviistationis]
MIYLIILIIGAILSVFGPWWIVAPLAFIVCRWKAKSSKQAFGQSTLALITLWIGYMTYIYLNSDVNLVNKMMGVLTSSAAGFGTSVNLIAIMAVTTILAIIVGGLGGLAGFNLKKI